MPKVAKNWKLSLWHGHDPWKVNTHFDNYCLRFLYNSAYKCTQNEVKVNVQAHLDEQSPYQVCRQITHIHITSMVNTDNARKAIQ